MQVTIGATGLKQAITSIKKDADSKREQIKKRVRIAAINIDSTAKQLCPVDTGRLRASIHPVFTSDYSAEVGTNVEYAEEIENGKSSQAPNGFLFPAAEAERADFVNDITNILKA